MQKHPKTTMIIVAGGTGTRMQANLPKQFLILGDKPIARYSFDLFLTHPEIDEIVVVCDPSFRHLFTCSETTKPIVFALPGVRRQDSVYNGLMAASPSSQLIGTHDGARPFIDHALIQRVLDAAKQHGAATAGLPIKFTVKESDHQNLVKSTPDRSKIWEIQTPQVLQRTLFEAGFSYANKHNLTVTDDVSLVELLGKEVKLVEGSHTNLKLTVPSDLSLAANILQTLAKK